MFLPLLANPSFWVDPVATFAGTERTHITLRNPTTAHAVLLLDDIQVAEVAPRSTITLSLPIGTLPMSWRMPEGYVHAVPDLVVTR